MSEVNLCEHGNRFWECGWQHTSKLDEAKSFYSDPTTVEVPIKWLEKLIELSECIDAHDFMYKADSASYIHLQGYIESAKELFKIGVEDET